MKREHIKSLVKLYLRIVNIFRKVKILDSEIYHYNMKKFSEEVNKMPYKRDPLCGLLDNVADPETFFDEKDENRDCDDWARQWSIWGVNNNYRSYEYVVWNPESVVKTFSTLHVITILEKEGRFYLMNYVPYGPFSSVEKCMKYMRYFPSYKDNMDYAFSREIKKELN